MNKFLTKFRTNICFKERVIGFLITLFFTGLCAGNFYHQTQQMVWWQSVYTEEVTNSHRRVLEAPSSIAENFHYVDGDRDFGPRSQVALHKLMVERDVADVLRKLETSMDVMVGATEAYAKAEVSKGDSLAGLCIFSIILVFMSWKLYSLED